jgi:hypothetical protein
MPWYDVLVVEKMTQRFARGAFSVAHPLASLLNYGVTSNKKTNSIKKISVLF